MPKLTGFVSHAFDDALYEGGKTAFRAAVANLFKRVETVLSNQSGDVSVTPYFVADSYGRELPAQLRRQLRESDFLIADLSTIEIGDRAIFNENVLFELGYALALDLPVFLVRNKNSKTLPSDVRDILAASYDAPSDIVVLLEAQLAQTLARVMSSGGSRASADARVAQTWFDPNVFAINIICTPEPERSRFASQDEPNYLFIDNLEDRDALLEVSTFLARQYPKANIIRHSADTTPPDALNGNLVVLGGPGLDTTEGNRITRELMQALKSDVRYCGDADGLEYNGSKFLAEARPDKSISLDWGCIIAAQNPMNPYARVVVCHGIYTYGTLAAALALSDLPTSMPNHLLLGDAGVLDPLSGAHQFEAVFRVPIVANGRISAPKLQRDLIRRIQQ
jgi:nucleoside 2-deoxyribosyltransferase